MAFSWTSITAGTTTITAAQMNEVKTNVDHLTTQLSVSAYSWSTLPVSQYAKANAANLTELQNAITYVDGLNVCATYNNAHDLGVDSGVDVGIHTGKDSSVQSSANSGIHTGKDVSYNNAQNSYYLNDHNTTVQNSQNSYYLNDHNTTVNSGQYSGALGSQNSPVNAANWGSAENGAEIFCNIQN